MSAGCRRPCSRLTSNARQLGMFCTMMLMCSGLESMRG